MADLGPGRLDHEPTGRLGGGRSRRTRHSSTAMDLPFAEGTKGPLRSNQFRLLGDLEFLSQPCRGKKPAGLSLDALLGRKAGCRKPWRRHPAFREAARLQNLGGGKAAGW